MFISLGAAWNAKLQIDIWWVANYEVEMEARCNSAWKASGTPASTVEFSPEIEFFFQFLFGDA